MLLLTQCPHCQRDVEIDESVLEQLVSCPFCAGEFEVPKEPQEVPRPPAIKHRIPWKSVLRPVALTVGIGGGAVFLVWFAYRHGDLLISGVQVGGQTVAGIVFVGLCMIALALAVMWIALPWLIMKRLDNMIQLLEQLLRK